MTGRALANNNVPVAASEVPAGRLDTLRRQLQSRLLKVDSRGDLLVARMDAIEGDPQEHEILLGSCLLPKSQLATKSKTIWDREDAHTAIVLTVDRFLCSVGGNKELHSTVAFLVATLVKFWEYLWINGIFSLKNAAPEHLSQLATGLAEEGWSGVLRIEERTRDLLDTDSNLAQSWIRHEKSSVSLMEPFRQALRTNVTGPELREAKALLTTHLKIPAPTRVRPRSSVSMLLQWFRAINSLFYLPAHLAPSFEPYPEYLRLAKILGRPPGRTRNLEVDECAALLQESVVWVYERSDACISMLERIEALLPQVGAGTEKDRTRRFRVILEEGGAFELVKSWGNSEVDGIYLLNRCIAQLYIGCFVLIAVMNARRKDEVSHRKFGLKRESLSVLSEQLEVYECLFYIEKTQLMDVPFFVNKATYKAWSVLSKLQDLFHRLLPGPKVSSLFWYVRIGCTGFHPKRSWFNFGVDHPHVLEFINRAMPGRNGLKIPAHSFRRIYAVIFFYRFEHATLQALSQQLQHLDMQTTFIYLRDALRTAKASRLPVELTHQKVIARDEFFQGVGQDLAQVGSEKFVASIEKVLEGTPYAGNFGRLVLKLHAKLASQADYSALAVPEQTQKVAEYMEGRGYYLEPFVHGDCMAGDGQLRPSSHCADPETGVLKKQNASPKTCQNCPYHDVSPGHLDGLRTYERKLSDRAEALPPGSIMRNDLESRLRDVAEVVMFHTFRLTSRAPI